MVTNRDFEPKPLHLHTLDSVCADLVSGLPIAVGSDGTLYSLPDDYTRSALQWYRKRGAANWSSSVTAQHGEQLVDSIFEIPPILPTPPANAANANYRKLRLQKIEIHRFAGVHKFGTPAKAPTNYVHEFSKPITLFEGFNGSGKTSIINAIIWALTGEILRSQREPDKAIEEFECSIVGIDESAEPTAHRLTPVTPLPDISQFRPDQPWVPADTWVELTFEDQTGKSLTPIRRSQSRTVLGKIADNVQGLENLQVDPISLRIGTLMPGLLPLIRVGSESELGKAVAQLTGLASLVDLADHARRTKSKIEKEFVKVKLQDIKSADESYERARKDLNDEIGSHPFMAPAIKLDPPSEDKSLENIIQEIRAHFENVKKTSLSSAQEILGNNFDPGDSYLRADLERNISPAFSELKQLARYISV